MSNKLHENNHTSPENQQDGNISNGNNAIGLDEGTMKLIVIVLGVLLFFGFVGVVGTIVYRVINLPQNEVEQVQNNSNAVFELRQTPEGVAFGNFAIEKPMDSKLKSFQVDGGIIYLYFENQLGVETIKIVRLSDGMVLGSVGFIEK